MDDCLFCAIIAGSIPSQTVHEDEHTVAFMDINPGSDGHLLVVPRTHSRDLLDITPDDLTACTLTAQALAKRAMEQLGADGVNLLNCCGADAWQSVFHFHIHLLPRYAGDDPRDRLSLPFPPKPGDAETIAAAAERLRGDPA